MKLKEVGETLKVHRHTVKKWINEGQLKATKVKSIYGRWAWDVSQEQLDVYLKQYDK